MRNKALFIFTLSFLLVACTTSMVFAQKSMSKKGLKVDNRLDLVYIDSDEGFDVIETPEKWKDESAVIICQSTTFVYSRESIRKIGVQEMSRKRIKLQDKAAVEEFSEFYYINVPNSSTGFKIIKPDGKEVDIDPSEAIEVTEEIPAMFRTYSSTLSYKKLAIPGLEVGDIIDYAYVYEDIKKPQGADVFDPVIMTLPREYPMVRQIVEFTVDKGFYLNFNSYNDAPELESVSLTSKQKADKRYRNMKKFSFIDDMREKEKDEKWYYPYRSLPTIKFQVYYLENSYNSGSWIFYLGEQGIPKKTVSKNKIKTKTSKQYNYTQPVYNSVITKYMKKYHSGETDQRKLVSLVYYYFRHLVTTYGLPESNRKEVRDLVFAKTMSTVLDRYGINVTVNTCVPRTIGTLDEVLFPAELSVFLTAEVGYEEYVILTNFDEYTNMGDVPHYLEGAEGVKPSMALEEGSNLPITSHKDNQTHNLTTINFNESMDELKVSRDFAHKGHNRKSEWDYLVISSEYLVDDLKKHPLPYKGSMKESKATENKKEQVEKRLEYIEESTSRELRTELTSYDSFELQADGRYHDAPELKYKETFTLSDLLQKAGGNYIVEIGKFIGGQVEITEDMQDRLYDIYMPYARSFINEIELTIPEGYSLEGLEALNVEVKNKTGMFKSTAKIDGNKLMIEAQKVYKHNYEPKENWSQMIEFLEAAYQFSQQKVVLKKK